MASYSKAAAMMSHESEYLVLIYNTYGASGIYDHVLKYHPDWSWSMCDPCDTDTPDYGDICAVCFSVKDHLVVKPLSN